MSAIQKLLTDHIDIWTAADTEKKSGRGRSSGNAASVYGIKKLRELILELAVRGKLVPQDPSDEPASELLDRIKAEKNGLIVKGEIKKGKSLPAASEEDNPFELPVGWEWVRLNELVSKLGAGSTPLGGARVYIEEGIPFLRSQNVWDEGLHLNDVAFIAHEIHQKMSGTHVLPLDLLFNITGASIGRCAIVPSNFVTGNVSQHVTIVRSVSKEIVNFLHLVLISKHVQKTVMDVQVGVSREGLSVGKLGTFLIPIPPLAEQHRIVAKVDELMALSDQLEIQHINNADAHEKLVSHLLSTLTESQSAGDFSDNWQQIAAHFDTLFTTEASIDALKQTLLQLAVMGKLVPQDPDDEPASKLLQRIQAEKAKLVAEGKIKKDKPFQPITDGERPYDLPKGWEWVFLTEITTPMDSGWSPACLSNSSPSEDVWGILKTTAVQVMQYLDNENKELPAKLEPRPDSEVRVGDILFTRAGPTNRVAISCFVQQTRKKLMISDKIIRFHPILIDGQFLALCLNVGATAAYLEMAKSGMAASQVNISQDKLRFAPVPIPPIELQPRIISKLEELMALCDRLKSRIKNAILVQQKISEVIVEQAVD